MPTSALGLALAAAFVHALWNLLLARARDVEAATAVALITAEVVFAPVAVWRWDAHWSVWPYLVASGAFEVAYFALLAAAYRRAPLSVVYPVARGGSPVLVLVIGAAVLSRATSWTQVAGVLVVVAGILLVRGFGDVDTRGVAFGLAIAGCIAGYTLVDKGGVRHAGPIPYLELSMVGPTVVYAGTVAATKRRGAVRAAVGVPSVVAGVATFVAYALVLAALQRASAASVAAVRETSVVIATALAAVVLREHVTRLRLAGAVLVVVGIAVLAA
jgi:drug/metabolite transporter (DMT)-like permease